ncbi:restriction endonuclease subunit S [Vibrio cholerae]
MTPYSEYKESRVPWLGKIPSHWKLLPCRAIVDNQVEKNDSGKIEEYLSLMANIGVVRYEEKGDVGNKKPEDLTKCKLVKQGNLVINSMNYAIGSYGMSPFNGVCSPVYIVLEPKEQIVERRYALRLFENKPMQKHLAQLGNGILQHRAAIKWDDIKPQAVPVPPLEEQRAILYFLDRETQRIDSLIEEKQTFIKLLKEKRQALISHVVTKGLNPNVEMQDSGIEWIGQVPKHWVVKKIKYDVLGIEQGWSPQCESTPVLDDHTWGVVKVGCVNRGIFNPEQNKKLPEELEPRKEYAIKKGDLLVSRANAKEWVGSAAVPDRDYDNLLLCDKIYRIKLDLEKADPEFFAYYLSSDQAREQIEIDATGTSSSMLNIGQGTILNMPIPAPELPEQQSIVQGIKNKTSQIDRLMLEVLDSIELLKEHRTSLISAAVTGKIDVREAV